MSNEKEKKEFLFLQSKWKLECKTQTIVGVHLCNHKSMELVVVLHASTGSLLFKTIIFPYHLHFYFKVRARANGIMVNASSWWFYKNFCVAV